jgi:hypothetical protein
MKKESIFTKSWAKNMQLMNIKIPCDQFHSQISHLNLSLAFLQDFTWSFFLNTKHLKP